MPDLGSATLTLRVAGEKFKKGLADAKGQADKTTKGIGGAFGRVQQKIQGAAGKVPVFGGALASLASPAGLAAAGIGLVVGGLTKMVTGVVRAEKELRPMIERSRIGGEALQKLAEAANRAGSEDGLEGVTDTAQELQLQLGELALTGGGRAKEALDALGLSAEELQKMEPEAAWRAVVAEIQKIPNVANRAVAAEEIFGGSSEKLAGIVNMTNGEFAALLETVEKTGDFLTEDQLADAKLFTEQVTKLKDSFKGVATSIGSALIPILTNVVKFFNDDLLPPIKDIARVMGPILIPILKTFASIFGGNIKTVLVVVADVLKFVSQVLTGDFAGAWQTVQHIAQTVMNGIIRIYNATIAKLPGVSKIDMLDFADNVKIAEEAADGLATSMDDMATSVVGAAETTAVAAKAMADEVAKAARSAAFEVLKAEQQLTRDLEAEGERRLQAARDQMAADKAIRDEIAEAEAKALQDRKDANKKFRDDSHAALLKSFGVTEVQYKLAQGRIKKLTAKQYADLIREAEEFGIDDLALLLAHNLKMETEQNRSIRELAQADADAKIAQAAADVAHRADLVAALDTHIATIATQIETADSNEKTALIAQLADLKTQRDTAYAASLQDRLNAAQAEIDAVGEKIKTAQGAELAALQAHAAALIAEYGVLSAGINAELEKIETPKVVEVITKHSDVRGTFSGGGDIQDDGSVRTAGVTFNDDGTISTHESTSGNSQDLYLDDSGNAYYNEELTQPAGDTFQDAVDQALGHDTIPGSQHGSLVRGVRSPLGRMIRVGENRTDEGIFPLPPGLLDSLRRGGVKGGGEDIGRPIVVQLQVGRRTMEEIVVRGNAEAQRSERID